MKQNPLSARGGLARACTAAMLQFAILALLGLSPLFAVGGHLLERI